MKTFKEILADVYALTCPYICWCNSEENLNKIYNLMRDYCREQEKLGHITDYGIECRKANNPKVNHNTVQLIRVGLGVIMPDGSNPQALIYIKTNDVRIYERVDPHVDPVDLDPPQQGSTQNDDYDRAMRIL